MSEYITLPSKSYHFDIETRPLLRTRFFFPSHNPRFRILSTLNYDCCKRTVNNNDDDDDDDNKNDNDNNNKNDNDNNNDNDNKNKNNNNNNNNNNNKNNNNNNNNNNNMTTPYWGLSTNMDSLCLGCGRLFPFAQFTDTWPRHR